MNNVQNHHIHDLLYMDALQDMHAGCVNDIDKQVLSYSPLPDTVIDPYLSQQVPSNDVMDLTYNSLSTWIEEAKKASYFTKHFVTLSKMINNGVATMARGLVTLHMNGEYLNHAPMSVDDLIGVGSYQFRKSYLGVLQTSARNPEIGERLLLNQMSWANTLLRLYKTKEKLAEKPVMKSRKFENKSVESGKTADNADYFLSKDSPALEPLMPGDNVLGLSEPSALSEPGAFTAIRAYGGFTGIGSRVSGSDTKQLLHKTGSNPENELSGENNEISGINLESAEIMRSEKDQELPERNTTENTALSGDNSVITDMVNDFSGFDSMKNGADGEMITQNEPSPDMMNESSGMDTASTEKPDDDSDSDYDELPKNSGVSVQDEGHEVSPDAAVAPEHQNEMLDALQGSEQLLSGLQNKFSGEPAEPDLSGLPPGIPVPGADHPPDYIRIMYNAFCRSGGSEDGTIIFTEDEIEHLLSDPVFCTCEKRTAEALRKLTETDMKPEQT